MEEAVKFIDDALRDTSLRGLFSQTEVQNLLLDIRWIIAPVKEVEDGKED